MDSNDNLSLENGTRTTRSTTESCPLSTNSPNNLKVISNEIINQLIQEINSDPYTINIQVIRELQTLQSIEFLKQYDYLDSYPQLKPHYIKCQHEQKEPTRGTKINPYGKSLTKEECLQAINQGYNIGILCHTDFGYTIYDKDGGTEFITTAPTFTVESRTGHQHIYYINSDITHNRVISNVGELKTWGKYVLCAGSIKKGSEGYRFYRIIDMSPLDVLSNDRLPDHWKERSSGYAAVTEETEVFSASIAPVTTHSATLHFPQGFKPSYCVNSQGENFDVCIVRCPSIIQVLKVPVDGKYKGITVDDSEHDRLCVKYLVNQGFSDSDAVNILRYYRSRAKLFRADYVEFLLRSAHWKPSVQNNIPIWEGIKNE